MAQCQVPLSQKCLTGPPIAALSYDTAAEHVGPSGVGFITCLRTFHAPVFIKLDKIGYI